MEGPDELCVACSKVDFYSLFTERRYFPGGGNDEKPVRVTLGTAAEITANAKCPFCRLLKHELFQEGPEYPWQIEGKDVSPSKIQCTVWPIRADYEEEMTYLNEKTRNLVATRLRVDWRPLDGLSEKENYLVAHQRNTGNGIQLLSPDAVDPTRPLLNGYQASTIDNNLDLLRNWMNTCVSSHIPESNERIYHREFRDSGLQYGIRVIDVENRVLVNMNPESIDYAALSYVWGDDQAQYIKLQEEVVAHTDPTGRTMSHLPSNIPRVIEDSIYVCSKLSIPYLWVDLYCIDQGDLVRKTFEIQAMGHIYRHSKLTLIAGSGLDSEAGLLPRADLGQMQKIETVKGRKYITSLPGIRHQIHCSRWHRRAWTMQEGQLATRCAFFGNYDISFMCESGHWRESLHSGPYAHDAQAVDINRDSKGYYALSALGWMKDPNWKFGDYNSLLMSYTPRDLSYESDKLNAISGCLNIFTERKHVSFICGLPARDFHYALLWTGEYDRLRDGFPSWSWAGWHCLQQSHLIYPSETESSLHSCSLQEEESGNLQSRGPTDPMIELRGLLISLTERPHRFNKCSQQFANIAIPEHKTSNAITIKSESAHFSLDIVPSASKPTDPRGYTRAQVPHEFDSTVEANMPWDSDLEYRTPYDRIRLRDCNGNVNIYHYPYWYDNPPTMKFNFPLTLRGSTLAWLLKDGIELIMILEVELLEGAEDMEPLNHVFCLGVDRREQVAHRFGMFCLPKEVWERAGPKPTTVSLG